jgi:hypothetical protein
MEVRARVPRRFTGGARQHARATTREGVALARICTRSLHSIAASTGRAGRAMARFAAMPDMTRRRRCGSRAAPTRHRGV